MSSACILTRVFQFMTGFVMCLQVCAGTFGFGSRRPSRTRDRWVFVRTCSWRGTHPRHSLFCAEIQRVLLDQIKILETMSPVRISTRTRVHDSCVGTEPHDLVRPVAPAGLSRLPRLLVPGFRLSEQAVPFAGGEWAYRAMVAMRGHCVLNTSGGGGGDRTGWV